MAGRLAGRIAELIKLPSDELRTIRQKAIADYPYPSPEIQERMAKAAQGMGLRVLDNSDLGPDILGQVRSNAELHLSPRLKKGKARVLAHEMGHWNAGHASDRSGLRVPIKELEAESVAFGVMHKLGVPLEPNLDMAASYIARELQPIAHQNPMAAYETYIPRISGIVQRIMQ